MPDEAMDWMPAQMLDAKALIPFQPAVHTEEMAVSVERTTDRSLPQSQSCTRFHTACTAPETVCLRPSQAATQSPRKTALTVLTTPTITSTRPVKAPTTSPRMDEAMLTRNGTSHCRAGPSRPMMAFTTGMIAVRSSVNFAPTC